LASGVAFAEARQRVSQARVTRRLPADGSGPRRLERAVRILGVGEGGDLILDDPVIPKPFATAIEGLAGGFSSQERPPGYGLARVLLGWTTGTLRLALGRRLWRNGGPSPDALAREWRRVARHRRRGRPASGLFAAG
jgi:hypothetical protein